MIRRTAALITTILLATATLAAPALASSGDEAAFAGLINQERSARDLSTLDIYWDLVDDARVHSTVMADADDIFHSSNLAKVTTGWSVLGENVGVGPTVGVLHKAFMNSAGHRDNILGDWDSMGVGVTRTDGGYMFVTVVFMKSAHPTPAPAPPVTTVTPAPAPVPDAVVAAASLSAPDPVTPAPAPAPAPKPVKRLIDDLISGGGFPFSVN